SVRVDPTLLPKIHEYGAFDIDACFNCGNCTAICPLSSEDENFPRRMIRYAQVGMKDKLLDSKELWLCYYCGKCSDTCPRQAEPGEFMAAARRYAIANYDKTSMARRLYTSNIFTAILLLGLTIFFGGGLVGYQTGVIPVDLLHRLFSFLPVPLFKVPVPAQPAYAVSPFSFAPAEPVHDVGVIALVLVLLALIVNAVTMMGRVWRTMPAGNPGNASSSTFRRAVLAARDVIVEIIVEQRYRSCEEDKESDSVQPWYLQRWFIHWAIMWGFLGLLAATALNFMFKPPDVAVPLWYPVRLLGMAAGILLVYGCTVFIVARFKKLDKYSAHSLLSDWLLIWLLWLTGV
ncbi:MAG TPA: 4Fe-4S dicluster domain-containing protein, partial [Anaerolineae bacterium]|nr:4Fe-4S dicluster domain-containing protein [Anaerolineae bacterium]